MSKLAFTTATKMGVAPWMFLDWRGAPSLKSDKRMSFWPLAAATCTAEFP